LSGAVNSIASTGNALEAVHLCLDMFERANIDRDSSHTGQTIVLFTAGVGVFETSVEYAKVSSIIYSADIMNRLLNNDW